MSTQDHGAAAALPSDLREPGEDSAPRVRLVETPVRPEGGEAQDGKGRRRRCISRTLTRTTSSTTHLNTRVHYK